MSTVYLKAFGTEVEQPSLSMKGEEPTNAQMMGLDKSQTYRDLNSESFKLVCELVLREVIPGRPDLHEKGLDKWEASFLIGWFKHATKSQEEVAEKKAFAILGGQGGLFE